MPRIPPLSVSYDVQLGRSSATVGLDLCVLSPALGSAPGPFPATPCPRPPPSPLHFHPCTGAAGVVDYLKVLDQLLGLDFKVHLVFALVPLQQLLVGELEGDLAARSHIDGDCEFLQLPPGGPEWGARPPCRPAPARPSWAVGSGPAPWETPSPLRALLASTSKWDNAGRIMGTFCYNHGIRAVLTTLAVVVCISESPCSPHILPKAGGTPLT